MLTETIMIASAAGVVGAGLTYGLMRGQVKLAMAEVQTALYAKTNSAAIAETRLERIGELSREAQAFADDLVEVKAERDALAVKAAKFDNMTDRDPETGRFYKREVA